LDILGNYIPLCQKKTDHHDKKDQPKNNYRRIPGGRLSGICIFSERHVPIIRLNFRPVNVRRSALNHPNEEPRRKQRGIFVPKGM
jgi:hypothetical protein